MLLLRWRWCTQRPDIIFRVLCVFQEQRLWHHNLIYFCVALFTLLKCRPSLRDNDVLLNDEGNLLATEALETSSAWLHTQVAFVYLFACKSSSASKQASFIRNLPAVQVPCV